MKKIIILLSITAVLAGIYFAGERLQNHFADVHAQHVEQLRKISE